MVLTALEVERRKKGLSALELSRRATCSPPVISNIENRRTYAWPKVRKQICTALELEEQKLFDAAGFARVIDL